MIEQIGIDHYMIGMLGEYGLGKKYIEASHALNSLPPHRTIAGHWNPYDSGARWCYVDSDWISRQVRSLGACDKHFSSAVKEIMFFPVSGFESP